MADAGSARFTSVADFSSLLAEAAKATKLLEALRVQAAKTGDALSRIGGTGGASLAAPARAAATAADAFRVAAVEAGKLSTSVGGLGVASQGTVGATDLLVLAVKANTRALFENTTAMAAVGRSASTTGLQLNALAGRTGATAEAMRVLSRESTVAGAGIRNGIGGAAIATAAALGYLSVKSVKAASDLVEQQNKANLVFGDSIGIVNSFAANSAQAFGLSQRAAFQATAQFGLLLKSAGKTPEAAAQLGIGFTKLASDLASFNNIDVSDAQRRLESGLVGQVRALRPLGIFLSDARLKTEAYASGIAAVGAKLTDAQKVQARYNIILHDTSDAQGDYARTSGQVANQLRTLKANAENAAAGFGKALYPAVRLVLGAINGLVFGIEALGPAGQIAFVAVTLLTGAMVANRLAAAAFGTEAIRLTTVLAGLRGLNLSTVLGVAGSALPFAAAVAGAIALDNVMKNRLQKDVDAVGVSIRNALKAGDTTAVVDKFVALSARLRRETSGVKPVLANIAETAVYNLPLVGDYRTARQVTRKQIEEAIKQGFPSGRITAKLETELEVEISKIAKIPDPEFARNIVKAAIARVLSGGTINERRFNLFIALNALVKDPEQARKNFESAINLVLKQGVSDRARFAIFIELIPKINKPEAKAAVEAAIKEYLQFGIQTPEQAKQLAYLLDLAVNFDGVTPAAYKAAKALEEYSRQAAEAAAQGQAIPLTARQVKAAFDQYSKAVADTATALDSQKGAQDRLSAIERRAAGYKQELTTHEKAHAREAKLTAEHVAQLATATKEEETKTRELTRAKDDLHKLNTITLADEDKAIGKAREALAVNNAELSGLQTKRPGSGTRSVNAATSGGQVDESAATARIRLTEVEKTYIDVLRTGTRVEQAHAKGVYESAQADLTAAQARQGIVDAELNVQRAQENAKRVAAERVDAVEAVTAAEKENTKQQQALEATTHGFAAGTKEATDAVLKLESAELAAIQSTAGLEAAQRAEIDTAAAIATTAAEGVKAVVDAKRQAEDADRASIRAQRDATRVQEDYSDAVAADSVILHGAAEGSRELRDATRGVADAQRDARLATLDIADANDRLRQAQHALRDTALDAADAQDSLSAAKRRASDIPLAAEEAQLNVFEARQRLQEVQAREGNKALEIARARIALKRAENALADFPRQAAADQRAVVRANNTVKDRPTVENAQRRDLIRASDGVGQAEEKQRSSTEAVTAAQQKLNVVTYGYGPASKEYRDALRDLQDRQQGLVDSQRNVADTARAAQEALARITDVETQATRNNEQAARDVSAAHLTARDAVLRHKEALRDLAEQQRVTNGVLGGFTPDSNEFKDAVKAAEAAEKAYGRAKDARDAFDGLTGKTADALGAVKAATDALGVAQAAPLNDALTAQEKITALINAQPGLEDAVTKAIQARDLTLQAIKDKEKDIARYTQEQKDAHQAILDLKKKQGIENDNLAKQEERNTAKLKEKLTLAIDAAIKQSGVLGVIDFIANGGLRSDRVGVANARTNAQQKEASGFGVPIPTSTVDKAKEILTQTQPNLVERVGRARTQVVGNAIGTAGEQVGVLFGAKIGEADLNGAVKRVVDAYNKRDPKDRAAVALATKLDKGAVIDASDEMRLVSMNHLASKPVLVPSAADPVSAKNTGGAIRTAVLIAMGVITPPVAAPAIGSASGFLTLASGIGDAMGAEIKNRIDAKLGGVGNVGAGASGGSPLPAATPRLVITARIGASGNAGAGVRASTGGFIRGAGTGDTVPALLEPGEFVVRKEAVRRIGLETLYAVNTDGDRALRQSELSRRDYSVGIRRPYLTAAASVGDSGPPRAGFNTKQIPPSSTVLNLQVYNPVGEPTEKSLHDQMTKLSIHGLLPEVA